MYEFIFGGVLAPSDEQLAFFWLGVGFLLAFPIRWILNICLRNSVIGWSSVCLSIATGMFLCNLLCCIHFYQIFTCDPILLASPPKTLLSVGLGLNPLYAYTLTYVFFDGSRWKRRCSKLRYQLIYHLNTPSQIALGRDKRGKIRNIYMGRYIATRIFLLTFGINIFSFFMLLGTADPAYIWLMILFNAISLPSTIYAFIFSIKKRKRWFFNIDERIARQRNWYDIDKYTGICADGSDEEWTDDKLKSLD